MAKSSAQRKCKLRVRQKAGRVVWGVELHENTAINALIEQGLLLERDCGNRKKCEAAAAVAWATLMQIWGAKKSGTRPA